MSKIAIVYWSGTGNTQAMAEAVEEGVTGAGAEATVLEAGDFGSADLGNYDAVIFGCSAQGDEELEADEMEPMFADCEPKLNGRTVGLFGSYEWNDGEWMETWKQRTEGDGAKLVGAVTAYGYPDDAATEACKKLGADVVAAIEA